MPSNESTLEAALDQAMTLARKGQRETTEQFIRQLREQFDVSAQPRAAIRVMLAESVMLAYDGQPQQARDRLKRVLALCRIDGEPGLTSLAHAWFAYVEMGAGHLSDCAQHAFDALKLGASTSDAACARAASLLGTLYAQSDAPAEAREWFELARRLAARDRDEIMISTVIFNMAASRFAAARVRLICEDDAQALDAMDVMFLRSSEHYDRGTGLAVQGFLHTMLRGFAHSSLSEHTQALGCFERFESQSTPAEWTSDALVPAERAWCRLQTGDGQGALADARVAEQGLGQMADQGESAIAHRRLSEVFGALSLTDEARSHRRSSDEALAAYRQAQGKIRILLDSYAVDPRKLG